MVQASPAKSSLELLPSDDEDSVCEVMECEDPAVDLSFLKIDLHQLHTT